MSQEDLTRIKVNKQSVGIIGLAKEDYGKALLLEFNKFLGRPYQEDVSDGLEIKVLGPGCARCDKL